MIEYRAKSGLVIGAVALLSLLALFAVENSKRDVRLKWYNEKLKAAQLAQKAEEYLKQCRLEKGVFIETVNDPNETSLIGQEFTPLTTDRGDIDAKLSSLNPNMAAAVVQYLKEAGVSRNDPVAIAFTGSFRAMNISVMAAVEVLQLRPLIISSVGSSNFGANDPNWTWLDMESALYQRGIFLHRSMAASIGGGQDIGRGLSPEGRSMILAAIGRNQIPLISEENLGKSINKRMEWYEKNSRGRPIRAFINVGGGIASLGHMVNADLLPSGLIMDFPEMNFPVRGVIVRMGQKKIPVIQLVNIKEILKMNQLPFCPEPLPEPGNGGIFVNKKYNLWVTVPALTILLISVVLIYLLERKYHRLGSDIISPDETTPKKEKSDDMLMEL